MTKNEIIDYAIDLKKKYDTNNPFILAENLGINIGFTSLKKTPFTAAYTLRVAVKEAKIIINNNFDSRSQKILCAHELGHALLHKDGINHFNNKVSDKKDYEFEANLFAVSLLFERNIFDIDIQYMNNYILKSILDYNITY